MGYDENIAGLGKNHDRAARENDLAKKQSQAKPAAENIDAAPHSVSRQQLPKHAENADQIHEKANDYAKAEHRKAANWENTSGAKDE